MSTVVYVACAQSREIVVLALDASSGALATLQRVGVDGAVMPLAVSPKRDRLYASLRSEPYALVTFAIDRADGRLVELGRAPLPASLCFIATDGGGRHLLGASYGESVVTVSPIDARGVAGSPQQVVPTEPNAHSIRVDPFDRRALVACLGGNVVRVMRFDPSEGRLSDPGAGESSAWQAASGSGPRHFVFGRDGRHVYLLNELDASIDVLAWDGGRASLASIQRVNALPTGPLDGAPWAADVHLTPDGRFLYASERRSSTLASFAVDAASGRLEAIGHVATEAQPRGFAVSPDGGHLVVVGQRSNGLACYAIDPRDGRLAARQRLEVGADPNWVEIVALPA